MKTLLLIRHAKSSHDFGVASDFERPLNERGFKEAAEMGKKLLKKKVTIDQFVSSPAIRARTTAELIAKEYQRKPDEIIFIPPLYHAYQEIFTNIIGTLDDAFQNIALFSHNPGITDFASSLTDTHINNMPTSSVFAVTANIGSWKNFSSAEKKFLFFLEK